MPTDQKGEQLKSLLTLLSQSATKQEVVDAFKTVTEYVKKIHSGNEKEWSLIRSAVSMLGENVQKESRKTINDHKQELMGLLTNSIKDHEKTTLTHDKRLKALEGIEKSLPVDTEGIIAEALKRVPVPIYDTSEDVRNKLELLDGDDRLDGTRVKGFELLEQGIEELKKRPIGRGAVHGFQLLINGVKKLLNAQTVNFVAGSGMGISYSYASGRNDVTFTSTGGGGLVGSQEKTTTSIDGIVQTFAFTHTPVLIFWNGALQTLTDDYTVSGKNITFTGTSTPQVNDKLVNVYA